MIIIRFTGGPIAANGYLAADADARKAVVIDCPHGTAGDVLEQIARRRLQLVAIVVTHAHWDHFGDSLALHNSTSAPLAAHEVAAPLMQDPDAMGLGMGVPVDACAPDRILREGDSVKAGVLALLVMHTPGHSPGSICLYERRTGVLFSGDTLFDGGYGRVDLPGGNKESMAASLRRLAGLPATTRVLPGHGAETSIGAMSRISGFSAAD
jgi:hydroxyacylglutathione hydrolase